MDFMMSQTNVLAASLFPNNFQMVIAKYVIFGMIWDLFKEYLKIKFR
jgi:hypothetical protein